MSNPPTLVFIPGACHKPTCYNKVIRLLQEHNLECIAVTLPSTAGDPEATYKDDIDAARDAISSEINGMCILVFAWGKRFLRRG